MTIDELKTVLYEQNYPKSYVVDAATYGLAFNAIVESKAKNQDFFRLGDKELGQFYSFEISIGPNMGLFFKRVELILEK